LEPNYPKFNFGKYEAQTYEMVTNGNLAVQMEQLKASKGLRKALGNFYMLLRKLSGAGYVQFDTTLFNTVQTNKKFKFIDLGGVVRKERAKRDTCKLKGVEPYCPPEVFDTKLKYDVSNHNSYVLGFTGWLLATGKEIDFPKESKGKYKYVAPDLDAIKSNNAIKGEDAKKLKALLGKLLMKDPAKRMKFDAILEDPFFDSK